MVNRRVEEEDIYFRVIAIPQFWVEVEKNIENEELLSVETVSTRIYV